MLTGQNMLTVAVLGKVWLHVPGSTRLQSSSWEDEVGRAELWLDSETSK